jgi:septal ring factor EnvC (AmiA/AmiB activator)
LFTSWKSSSDVSIYNRTTQNWDKFSEFSPIRGRIAGHFVQDKALTEYADGDNFRLTSQTTGPEFNSLSAALYSHSNNILLHDVKERSDQIISKIENANKNVINTHNYVGKVQDNVNFARESIENANKDVIDTYDYVGKVQDNVNFARTEIGNIKADIDVASTKASDRMGIMETVIRRNMTTMEQKIDTLSETLDDMSTKAGNADDRLDLIEQRSIAMDEKIDGIQNDVNQIKGDIREIKNMVAEIHAALNPPSSSQGLPRR